MNILNDKSDFVSAVKSETELVEREKHEYKLIGRFTRTPGLKLFQYNHIENTIKEVDIIYDEVANLKFLDGKPVITNDTTKCNIDSRFEHFESLNIKTARKRVERYRMGLIKDLCNLIPYNPEPLKIF